MDKSAYNDSHHLSVPFVSARSETECDSTIVDYEVSHDVQLVQLSKRAFRFIFTGLAVSMLLAALDQTIVTSAIRTIGDDLRGYNIQAWVTTAYLITSTLTTPLYGKLADIYGRKNMYLLAIGMFLLGSVLCSVINNMYELTVMRAVQGIGGGGIMALTLTVMADITSPRNRSKYQGIFVAVFATSSVLGPVLGGLLAGQDYILGVRGWRWVFLINVPIGIIAVGLVFFHLRYDIARVRHKIDFLGVLTLTTTLVPLLTVAQQGNIWGWSSSAAIGCYLVTVIGLVCFVWCEKYKGESAILPLRIFTVPTFTIGVLVTAVCGAILFSTAALLPQYLQVVRGFSPSNAGLLSTPQAIANMVTSFVSGVIISRRGTYHRSLMIGAVLVLLASSLYACMTAEWEMWVVLSVCAVLGGGLGCLLQPATLAIQNSLPRRDMSIATASASFFRSIGGTIGVAASLSIVFSHIEGSMHQELSSSMHDRKFVSLVQYYAQQEETDPTSANVLMATAIEHHDGNFMKSLQEDTEKIDRLDPTLAKPIKYAFSNAMQVAFIAVAGFSLLMLLLIAVWKEKPIGRDESVQLGSAP